MADGAIMGRRARYGTVVPGSAAETVITGCEYTLPTTDGFYKIHGEIALNNPSNSVHGAIEVNAEVYVNDSAVAVGAEQMHGNVGGAGVTGGLSVTGTTVRLTVQDCSGIRAVGMLELFGVEMTITPA